MFSGWPFHVFSTEFWRARAYEKDTCHGLGLWFIAFRFSVASTSDWPPDKNCSRQNKEWGQHFEAETLQEHPPSTPENGDASGYNYAFNDIQVGERVHHNARNSWWHTSLQQCKCVLRNLFRCRPLRTLSSRSDHARLQENSLKQHMVLSQEEEHFWPDLLSNLQSPIDAVASIKKNLRLNNWHQSIILHMSR